MNEINETPDTGFMALDGKFVIAAVFSLGIVAAMLLGREIPEAIQILASAVIFGAIGIGAAQWTPPRR